MSKTIICGVKTKNLNVFQLGFFLTKHVHYSCAFNTLDEIEYCEYFVLMKAE